LRFFEVSVVESVVVGFWCRWCRGDGESSDERVVRVDADGDAVAGVDTGVVRVGECERRGLTGGPRAVVPAVERPGRPRLKAACGEERNRGLMA
jgi:hypothetical protein